MPIGKLLIEIKMVDKASPAMRRTSEGMKKMESHGKGVTTSLKRMDISISGVVDKLKMLGLIGMGTMAALFINTGLMGAAFKILKAALMPLFLLLQKKVIRVFKDLADMIKMVTKYLKEHPALLNFLQNLVAIGMAAGVVTVFLGALGLAFGLILKGLNNLYTPIKDIKKGLTKINELETGSLLNTTKFKLQTALRNLNTKAKSFRLSFLKLNELEPLNIKNTVSWTVMPIMPVTVAAVALASIAVFAGSVMLLFSTIIQAGWKLLFGEDANIFKDAKRGFEIFLQTVVDSFTNTFAIITLLFMGISNAIDDLKLKFPQLVPLLDPLGIKVDGIAKFFESIYSWLSKIVVKIPSMDIGGFIRRYKEFLGGGEAVGGRAPTHQVGGVVAKTGLIFAHAGETIVPTHRMDGGPGGNNIVNINITDVKLANGLNIRELARQVGTEVSRVMSSNRRLEAF